MIENMAKYFMPSEIARLILGYLIDQGLTTSTTAFIRECPDLTEFYQVMRTGSVPPTTIMGQSLVDILNEFAELKLRAVRSGQSRVPSVVQTECVGAQKQAIVHAKEHAEKVIKQQRLVWKERRARRLAKFNETRQQDTAAVGGDSANSHAFHAEEIVLSAPSFVVPPERTSASGCTKTGTMSTSGPSHVTSPEYISNDSSTHGYKLVSGPSHAASPGYIPFSGPSHVANPNYTPVSGSSHTASPGYTHVSGPCHATTPGYTPVSAPCYAASPGYAPVSGPSHTTSPGYITVSGPSHATSPRYTPVSGPSHSTTPGYTSVSAPCYATSPGYAPVSGPSHTTSPGYMAVLGPSHANSPRYTPVSDPSHATSPRYTPVSDPSHATSPGYIPVSHPSHATSPRYTPVSDPSHATSPGYTPVSGPSHSASPKYTDLSGPSHSTSPKMKTVLTSGHVTDLENVDIEPVITDNSASAAAGGENIPSVSTGGQTTNISDVSAAGTNLDTEVLQQVEAKHSTKASCTRVVAEENGDLLEWLLSETNFHEKLADNINKTLLNLDTSDGNESRRDSLKKARSKQRKNKAGITAASNKKNLTSKVSMGFNIDQIIERTESDPTFQNFLQLFQQGTAIPLSQLDVPVINISSEITGSQACISTGPAVSSTIPSEMVPHSCKSTSTEAAGCVDDASGVVPSCSITAQPTDILHPGTQQSTEVNPCGSEKCDEILPCNNESSRQSHIHDAANSLFQNNLSTFASSPRNAERDGPQKVVDQDMSPSSHLVTCNFSENCVASVVNCTQDQVIVSPETTDAKNSPQIAGSLSDDITAGRTFSVPVNENSLTVFSLIEKSVAEMNGEQFIHRSLRNSFSVNADSIDNLHRTRSVDDKNSKNIVSTLNVSNSTSREVVNCQDKTTDNLDDCHSKRTDNFQLNKVPNSSQDTNRLWNVSVDLCSTHNMPGIYKETAKENVSASGFGPPADGLVRTNDPEKILQTCLTVPTVGEKTSKIRSSSDHLSGDSRSEGITPCHSNSLVSKHGHVTDIVVDTHAAINLSAGNDAGVNQEEIADISRLEDGEQVVSASCTCAGAPGLKKHGEIEISYGTDLCLEQNTNNSAHSFSKKMSNNLSVNLPCDGNNVQCTSNSNPSSIFPAAGTIRTEVKKTADLRDMESVTRSVCVSEREQFVDNQDRFCMSPPVTRPGRLQLSMIGRHTKGINQQPEVQRSQSLSDCSSVLSSPPYFPLNITDNKCNLSGSIHPQTTCSSLPTNLSHVAPIRSPNFFQSPDKTCNSSVKLAPQMTPPQDKQLQVNAAEENQLLPKTVKRRVIAVHSEHAPFIPDHYKKNPSRRIAPKEVDYSTPSPLQDCPSSPMNYVLDHSLSQPSSPFSSKEGISKPLNTGKPLSSLNGHVRMNSQKSFEVLCHSEKSASGGVPLSAAASQEKMTHVSLSHLDKLGIKLPPSPSKRKPRRVHPIRLSAVTNKDSSNVAVASTSVCHDRSSQVVDDVIVVSSTSDSITSSEEEAFRLLKSFLSSSYSKPQPRQEITSTEQKPGASKHAPHSSKSHSRHKGGKKTPLVKDSAVLATVTEIDDNGTLKINMLTVGDSDDTRRSPCLAEPVVSGEEGLAEKGSETDHNKCQKEQATGNVCLSNGMSIKNSVHRVRCLHSRTHPASSSPCSHDSNISFAAVGIMESYPIEGDNVVPRENGCKVTAATTSCCSSLSNVVLSECLVNIPCVTESVDVTHKGLINNLCASEQLGSHQNDIDDITKMCTETLQTTSEAEKVRSENSSLVSVAGDKISVVSNICSPGDKAVNVSDCQCLQTDAHRTLSAEENRTDNVRSFSASSGSLTVASPTVAVADRARDKSDINNSHTVKSSFSLLSASEEQHRTPVMTSAVESALPETSDMTVLKECQLTRAQSQSCSQQKQHLHSDIGFPSTNSSDKLLNVSDSVADAVYSLLSLVSRVDDNITNLVSLTDQNLLDNADSNHVSAANELPVKNTRKSCDYLSPATSVVVNNSLPPLSVMSSDLSLPSFLSGSLRLAHGLDHPCQVPGNDTSTPVLLDNSNWLGQGARRNSDHVSQIDVGTSRPRPCSPCSTSLLSRAMADCGIPFEGSNLTLLETVPKTGHSVCRIPEPHFQTPVAAPDCSNADMKSETRMGRKPRPSVKKLSCRDVKKIVPNLGVHNFNLIENKAVEQLVHPQQFVSILPKVSKPPNESQNPCMTNTEGQNSSLCQIQVIPSSTGPVIIIPPGFEGIIDSLLSGNTGLHSNPSTTGNDALAGPDHRQPRGIEALQSVSISCGDFSSSQPTITAVVSGEEPQCQSQGGHAGSGTVQEPGNCSSHRKLSTPPPSSSSSSKLPSKDLCSRNRTNRINQSDSLGSGDEDQLPTLSNYRCNRKVAIRRKVASTDFRAITKLQMRRKKKAMKTGIVAESGCQAEHDNRSQLRNAQSSKGKHSVSFCEAPCVKHTENMFACDVKGNPVVVQESSQAGIDVADHFAHIDALDGAYEVNRQNGNAIQSSKSKQTAVTSEIVKDRYCASENGKTGAEWDVGRDSRGCAVQTCEVDDDVNGKNSNDTWGETNVLCKDKNSGNEPDALSKNNGAVCGVESKNGSCVSQKEKLGITREVERESSADCIFQSERTGLAWEVQRNTEDDSGQHEKTVVICKVNKSSKDSNDIDKSDTANLTDYDDTSNRIVNQGDKLDKDTEMIHLQSDSEMSSSEQKFQKCSVNKLLSCKGIEEVENNIEIRKSGSTHRDKNSITAGTSCLSSLFKLREKSKNPKSKKLKNRVEMSLYDKASLKVVSATVHEDKKSVLNSKSLGVLKVSKNNSRTQVTEIDKKKSVKTKMIDTVLPLSATHCTLPGSQIDSPKGACDLPVSSIRKRKGVALDVGEVNLSCKRAKLQEYVEIEETRKRCIFSGKKDVRMVVDYSTGDLIVVGTLPSVSSEELPSTTELETQQSSISQARNEPRSKSKSIHKKNNAKTNMYNVSNTKDKFVTGTENPHLLNKVSETGINKSSKLNTCQYITSVSVHSLQSIFKSISPQVAKSSQSTPLLMDAIVESRSDHSKYKCSSDASSPGPCFNSTASRNRQSKVDGHCEKTVAEQQECHAGDEMKLRSSYASRNKNNKTLISCEKIPQNQEHNSSSTSQTGAGKCTSHTTSSNTKNKAAVSCREALPKHQECKSTRRQNAAGKSKSRVTSVKKQNTGEISSSATHKEEKFGQGKLDICSRDQEASIVDVEYMSNNVDAKETEHAVASLELCMRESNNEHIHNCKKQPEPLLEVSEFDINEDSLLLLESSICLVPSTPSPIKQQHPSGFTDISPMKSHLPPKKRLSSDFIVNGTADIQVQQHSPPLSRNDSAFSTSKATVCLPHTSPMWPSEVVQDSLQPETVAASRHVDIAHDQTLSPHGVSHSRQLPSCLITQTKPSHSDAIEETTNTSTVNVSVSNKEIDLTSVPEALDLQPSYSSTIQNTPFSKIILERPSLFSCTFLSEKDTERFHSSSTAAAHAGEDPCRHGSNVSDELTVRLPSSNICHPSTALNGDVTPHTISTPLKQPAQFEEKLSNSSHSSVGLKVDKLLRKLHKRKKKM